MQEILNRSRINNPIGINNNNNNATTNQFVSPFATLGGGALNNYQALIQKQQQAAQQMLQQQQQVAQQQQQAIQDMLKRTRINNAIGNGFESLFEQQQTTDNGFCPEQELNQQCNDFAGVDYSGLEQTLAEASNIGVGGGGGLETIAAQVLGGAYSLGGGDAAAGGAAAAASMFLGL